MLEEKRINRYFSAGTTFDEFRSNEDLREINDFWLLFMELDDEILSGYNVWPVLLLIPHLILQFILLPNELLFIISNTLLLITYIIIWPSYPVVLLRFTKQTSHAINTFLGILLPLTTILPGYVLLEFYNLNNIDLLYFFLAQIAILIVPAINAFNSKEMLYNIDYTFPKDGEDISVNYTIDILSWAFSGDIKKEMISIKLLHFLTASNDSLLNAAEFLKLKYNGTKLEEMIDEAVNHLKSLDNVDDPLTIHNEDYFSVNIKELERSPYKTSGFVEATVRYLNSSSNPEKKNTPENRLKWIIKERTCCEGSKFVNQESCILCERSLKKLAN